MKPTERLELTDKIGRALQARFGYAEIDEYLHAHGIPLPTEQLPNSKRLYSKSALKPVAEAKLLEIAEELGVLSSPPGSTVTGEPKNWKGTKQFRLFISHISKHKKFATRLKDCLSIYGVAGFVAHEDIHPTEEWQDEIVRALRTMDGFLAMHTLGFSQSVWTQQEVGYALGRGVKIISFKMNEDPTGFISRKQALTWRNRTAELVAKEVHDLLAADPLTANRLTAAHPTVGGRDEDDLPF